MSTRLIEDGAGGSAARRPPEYRYRGVLLTVKGAAIQLRMSASGIRYLARVGRLAIHNRTENGERLFHPDEVRALVLERARVATRQRLVDVRPRMLRARLAAEGKSEERAMQRLAAKRP